MAQKAFPWAYGPAKGITGGKGGVVRFVSNKNDSGAGSFRTSVEDDVPAIVVFLVGGIFDLSSDIFIGSNKTILGGLCPGNAPTFRYRAVRIASGKSNIIIRYIRARVGDTSGLDLDSFTASNASNFIVDHSSFSWSVDEILSTVSGSNNFSIQNCIMSEALNASVHSQGRHAFGGIVGTVNVCFYRNLMAHFYERGPLISDNNDVFDMRNCFIYNWRQKPATGGINSKANLLNNYFKPGPTTTQTESGQPTWSPLWATNFLHPSQSNLDPLTLGKFYLEGNILEGTDLGTTVEDQWIGVKMFNTDFQTNHLDKTKNTDGEGNIVIHPLPTDWYENSEVTATQARDQCLAGAGASITRDVHDLRVVENATNGTTSFNGSVTGLFGLIDSQTDVGGWGAEVTTPDVLTGPSSHPLGKANYLPSWFVTKYGLDPDLNYIDSGNPSTAPHRFIFFENNTATNYKVTAPVGWENIVHHDVYDVLLFELNGEIDSLIDEIPIPPEQPRKKFAKKRI